MQIFNKNMPRALILPLLICLFVLAACALPVTNPPKAGYTALQAEIRHEKGDLLERHVRAQQRLAMVAAPLLVRNARLCPRRAYSPGFTVYSDFDLPPPLQDVARARLGLGREARVLSVFTDSEAWHAGLRPDDVILSFNDKPVRNAGELRARVKKIKDAQLTRFGVIRDGRAFSIAIRFRPICNYRLVYLADDPDLNAYADGTRIFLTPRMMDFTTDDELAVVIGHELAHNIMHHPAKDAVNTIGIEIAGGIVDGLFNLEVRDMMMRAYIAAFSPAFETEADYVGIYLLARAGGNISVAAPFWRKMAAETGISSVTPPPDLLKTHPASPERFAVLRAAEAEIRAKTLKKEPLLPELDAPWNFGARYAFWSDNDDTDDEPQDTDLNH